MAQRYLAPKKFQNAMLLLLHFVNYLDCIHEENGRTNILFTAEAVDQAAAAGFSTNISATQYKLKSILYSTMHNFPSNYLI